MCDDHDHDASRSTPRSSRSNRSASRARRAGALPTGAYAASCTLTPEMTAGPYYLDLGKIRRNITEGRPGLRLDLRVRVVDAATCKPLRDVAVDMS